jgi:hypothetical protein
VVDSLGFYRDLEFLRRHTEIVLLEGSGGERVAVAPQWQGKTMTSTVGGPGSLGFGWINEAFISSGRVDQQANLHGGEDRFWIGPEGGQFAFYFEPGQPFEFAAWRCPALIDRQPFEVTSATATMIRLRSEGRVRNHLGTEFQLRLEREVELLERASVERLVDYELPPGVSAVGHESRNCLTNAGSVDWQVTSGLPCIWNLGMFRPTPRTVMLLPFQREPLTPGLPEVTSDYFGPVDASRLRVDRERGIAFFKGDGRYRSKLGVGFGRAKGMLGSWTPEERRLTIVQFNLPERIENGYCNNLWQIQAEPFRGDVVNVYNDGPNETGGCLGPFYELETLSPALCLLAGKSYNHMHRTLHIVGERDDVGMIAERLFDVTLEFVESVFFESGPRSV